MKQNVKNDEALWRECESNNDFKRRDEKHAEEGREKQLTKHIASRSTNVTESRYIESDSVN